MSTKTTIYLGIDAGGTKTNLAVSREPQGVDSEDQAPGINASRDGLEGSAQALASLIRRVQPQRDEAQKLNLVAGIAGAGSKQAQREIADRLTADLATDFPGGVLMEICHDGSIAIDGALGPSDSGLAIMIGTGSILMARGNDGTIARSGGWGRVLGDEASGYRLGRLAIRAASAQLEGGPKTTLSDLLRTEHGMATWHDVVTAVYVENLALEQMAPTFLMAVRDGDEVACQLLRDEVSALFSYVPRLLSSVGTLDHRVALGGGIGRLAEFRGEFERELADFGPDWRLERMRTSPVQAALERARKLVEL